MDFMKLRQLGIDTDKGLGFFAGDSELYELYLNKLLRYNFPAVIRHCLAAQDINGAFHTMHKFKALVGYVSVPRLEDIVGTMTETLRAGKTVGVSDGLAYVEDELANLRAALGVQLLPDAEAEKL